MRTARLSPVAAGIGVSFSNGPVASGQSSGMGLASFGTSVPMDVASAPQQLADVTLGAGESVSWSLDGAANVTPTVSGSTATYAGILPGTTLELATTDVGVKESFVLSSASAGNSWTFPLTLTGLSLVDDPASGWELVTAAGGVAAYLPTPYAYDATALTAEGAVNPNGAVAYSLSTSGSGQQELTMTLDPAWLGDPSRVFPVTVDPTISTVGSAGSSTYIVTNQTNNNSTSSLLSVGKSPGSSTWFADGLVYISNSVFQNGGVPTGNLITSASISLYDVWASTASAEPVTVAPIEQYWSASGTQSAPGPTVGPVMGTADVTATTAHSNNQASLNLGTYTKITVPISNLTEIDQWTNGNLGNDYGFEIGTTDVTDSNGWKKFASMTVSGETPYVTVTYTPDIAPQITGTSPATASAVSTLSPTLSVTTVDANEWPMKCDFVVYDGASGAQLLDSGWTTCAWEVPLGLLKWGSSMNGEQWPMTGRWSHRPRTYRRSQRRCLPLS